MVKDQSAGIYERAIQNQNVARALTDQADVAQNALKPLADEAEKAAKAAADAAAAASVALTEQQAHQVQLIVQLAILETNTNQTEADFETGVAVARQAAATALAAQLAAVPRAGQISSAGWARPADGHISSPYGFGIDHTTARTPFTPVPTSRQAVALRSTLPTAAPSCSPDPTAVYGNYIRIQNDGAAATRPPTGTSSLAVSLWESGKVCRSARVSPGWGARARRPAAICVSRSITTAAPRIPCLSCA